MCWLKVWRQIPRVNIFPTYLTKKLIVNKWDFQKNIDFLMGNIKGIGQNVENLKAIYGENVVEMLRCGWNVEMGTLLTICGEQVGNTWGICWFLANKLPTFSLSNNSLPAPKQLFHSVGVLSFSSPILPSKRSVCIRVSWYRMAINGMLSPARLLMTRKFLLWHNGAFAVPL